MAEVVRNLSLGDDIFPREGPGVVEQLLPHNVVLDRVCKAGAGCVRAGAGRGGGTNNELSPTPASHHGM